MKLFKPCVNTHSNNRTSGESVSLLCRKSTSSGLCSQLEQGIEQPVRLEKARERAVVSRPQHSFANVMPVRQPLRRRYYERQHLCPILLRVLVFVMLPRYCLSMAGKSCPIETVLLSIITLLLSFII